MTPLINWLALLLFSVCAVPFARWAMIQSFSRWQGPRNGFSIAFIIVLTVAGIGGLSFAAASVLYYKLLFQDSFMAFHGFIGALKLGLILSGVWYGLIFGYRLKDEKRPPS